MRVAFSFHISACVRRSAPQGRMLGFYQGIATDITLGPCLRRERDMRPEYIVYNTGVIFFYVFFISHSPRARL